MRRRDDGLWLAGVPAQVARMRPRAQREALGKEALAALPRVLDIGPDDGHAHACNAERGFGDAEIHKVSYFFGGRGGGKSGRGER